MERTKSYEPEGAPIDLMPVLASEEFQKLAGGVEVVTPDHLIDEAAQDFINSRLDQLRDLIGNELFDSECDVIGVLYHRDEDRRIDSGENWIMSDKARLHDIDARLIEGQERVVLEFGLPDESLPGHENRYVALPSALLRLEVHERDPARQPDMGVVMRDVALGALETIASREYESPAERPMLLQGIIENAKRVLRGYENRLIDITCTNFYELSQRTATYELNQHYHDQRDLPQRDQVVPHGRLTDVFYPELRDVDATTLASADHFIMSRGTPFVELTDRAGHIRYLIPISAIVDIDIFRNHSA